MKAEITRGYLKYRMSLAREALVRLAEKDERPASSPEEEETEKEDPVDETINLNDARIGAVLAAIKGCGARSVLDLGCGSGQLLRELLKITEIERLVGLDVSIRSLEIASRRLHLDRLPRRRRERIELMHGSLLYRDKRIQGFDAAAVVEVVEHFDPPRLPAFARVLFEQTRPRTVVMTTPNREYNITWGIEMRHRDHRFEWTREEFRSWALEAAGLYEYRVRFLPVGPEDPELGAPTQMGIFELA
jgi:3' terminal RNA ribose 2'-O-methyltransferase Hen1